MTPQYLVQPDTSLDAINLMLSATVPFDSPTNHRLHARDVLERAFAADRRRPEWVWIARDDQHVLASVSGMAVGDSIVLDHWGGDPEYLDLPLAEAARTIRGFPGSQACLHVPAAAELSEPPVAMWRDKLTAHGWRLLVRRHHYETPVTATLAMAEPSPLRLDKLIGPDDPRLRPLFRGILLDSLDSLDAHDLELVERVGLDDAATQSIDDLLDADPWQCIRLALDDTDTPVGMVSWVSAPNGRGFVNFVGVATPARGQGYGRQLLARATRELATEGAMTLIADTDADNHPMVAAFDRLGWTTTETRIDFLRA